MEASQKSTYSAAASRDCARTSPSPARAEDSTGSARVFGPSSLGSFASLSPDGSSWRTSQLSLLEDSTEFSETWPRSGMTRNGTAYLLRPSAPLTGGTASGLLPTPAASPAGWEHIEVVDRDGNPPTHGNQRWYHPETGRVVQKDLRHIIERDMWPTPHGMAKPGAPRRPGPSGNELGRAVNEAEQWRTPNAHDGSNRKAIDPDQRIAEGRQVGLTDQVGGSLNPTWVEWLQGFPLGWTDLPPSAMPSSRKSRNTSVAASSKRNRS